jgi:hypothetical protein
MHKQTGAIAQFETEADAKAAGYTVPLDEDQLKKVQHMNRAERRKWAREEAARQRHARKLAPREEP